MRKQQGIRNLGTFSKIPKQFSKLSRSLKSIKYGNLSQQRGAKGTPQVNVMWYS